MEYLAAARLAPAKQRAHPREKLVVGERLDEIVVGTGVQAGDAVGDGVAGGQHQDRDVRSGAQPPAHLDAVDARQHHVEDDEVGWLVARFDERVGTVGHDVDRVALVRERAPERRSEASIVVHHQDPSARAHARMMAGMTDPSWRRGRGLRPWLK